MDSSGARKEAGLGHRTYQGVVAVLATIVVVALSGCSPAESTSPTSLSASPTSPPRVSPVVIECDPAVRADACRATGEKILAGSGTLAIRAVRLVLRGSGGVDARCFADFFDAAGVKFATASIVCPEAPSST